MYQSPQFLIKSISVCVIVIAFLITKIENDIQKIRDEEVIENVYDFQPKKTKNSIKIHLFKGRFEK